MREIKYTTRFKRDYQRERSGRHGKKLDALLMEAVTLLVNDMPLPSRNFDHPLSGGWSDPRDVSATLELMRLGSHSELGFRRHGRSQGLKSMDALIRSWRDSQRRW